MRDDSTGPLSCVLHPNGEYFGRDPVRRERIGDSGGDLGQAEGGQGQAMTEQVVPPPVGQEPQQRNRIGQLTG